MGFRNRSGAAEGGSRLQIGASFGLSTANGVTVGGWTQFPIQPTGTNKPVMFLSPSNVVVDDLLGIFCVASPATTFGFRWGLDSSFHTTVTVSSAPGSWFYVAATVSASKVGVGYIGIEGQGGFKKIGFDSDAGTMAATFNGYTLGDCFASITATPGAGALSNWRTWARVLTHSELVAEMKSAFPVSRRDLNSWHPLTGIGSAKAIDYSGLARHFSTVTLSNPEWPDPDFTVYDPHTLRRRRRGVVQVSPDKWQAA